MATVTVMEWQRVLLFVNGRLDRVLEPGRHRYRAKHAALVPVEMRPRVLIVSGQELITRDGLSLRVSVAVTWSVTDPVRFTTGAESAQAVLHGAVQEAIREAVAATTFDELLADRARLSDLAAPVSERTSTVGVTVTETRARDLMLPGELRRATQDTILARERGRADLERARAEAASLRTLANAARVLEEHPTLLRLRTLQVAAEPGTRIILDPRAD
ncbi:slipin family protein [Actinomadura macra]|uniref:slipin family protein n=1 Tax=Actinomadura macra TaxID=46164 RepID=UPI0008361489|nr:slipin family protein [Actinomadura macra]